MADTAAPSETPPTTSGGGSVHEVLREEIVSGVLRPGAAVHEVALSQRLGVSRAPVRDAILRLEADGLVIRGPRGTVVRTRTADEIYDIYQARIALESEAAAVAASRATHLDIERLAILHDEGLAEKDHVRERALHAQWHTALAAAARNQTIIEILDRLTMQLAPYETASLADAPNLDQTEDEHTRLLEAIRTGDAATARSLVATHLERTRDVRVHALLRDERCSSHA